LGIQVDKDMGIIVVWKRGRLQDETQIVEVNEFNVDYDINATFSKPSKFWMKNS
jgi:hypothetical protein